MRLQHLAIIFIIVILPIALVIGEYIQTQIDAIYLYTSYNKRLQDATYDALKAFQINTVNNKYSSLSDSKIRDIEASVTTFYNSLGTSMVGTGYDLDELKEYVPAMVYTMYDGYYIYGKYYNYKQNGEEGEYQIGLKPYIYYACRYKNGANDFVVNYTLDNSITIYGMVNGEYVTKSGYLINPQVTSSSSDGYAQSAVYEGITIGKETLKEQLVSIDENGDWIPSDPKTKPPEYEYVVYNNQKIYKDYDGRYFICTNNRRQYISDAGKVLGENEITPSRYMEKVGGVSNSAAQYYADAMEFSTWVKSSLSGIKQMHAVDSEGNPITNFVTDTGNSSIFDFNGTNNNPLTDGSTFNEHRMNVIRRSIETNIASAIANYNVGSGGTYEYKIPAFTDDDWEKLLNNISLSVFMQGIPIKAKYFNSYCIVTNDKNKEVVTKDSIYVIAENPSNHLKEAHLPGCTAMIDNNYTILGAYNITDFQRQTVTMAEGNERHYYPQYVSRCYNCIVNVSQNYDLDSIIEGNLRVYNKLTGRYEIVAKDISALRRVYLTALARERYDLYRSNRSFGI